MSCGRRAVSAILDQAFRIEAGPQAPHARRADVPRAECFARKGDAASAARERAAAGRLRPTTVFDHFLAGREGYKRQDWKTALAEFETVLRMQPDHFWALCLGAIAALQTNQPGMATFGLNDCIKQEPQFAWLYVLRGFASGQSAVQARTAGRTLKIEDGSIEAAVVVRFEAAEDASPQRRSERPRAKSPTTSSAIGSLASRSRLDAAFCCGRLGEAVADLRRWRSRLGRAAIPCLRQPGPGSFSGRRSWDEAVESADSHRRSASGPELGAAYQTRRGRIKERDDQIADDTRAALRNLETAIRYEKAGNPILASDHTRAASC